jgi:hypothetical protein
MDIQGLHSITLMYLFLRIANDTLLLRSRHFGSLPSPFIFSFIALLYLYYLHLFNHYEVYALIRMPEYCVITRNF